MFQRSFILNINNFQYTPSQAAYFAGTFGSFSEPLRLRKTTTPNTVAPSIASKLRKPTINLPLPPVDNSYGRNPVTPPPQDTRLPRQDARPPSIIPPKYLINHETEYDGKEKPSLGVDGFVQAEQREPTAIDFGFLPVFPWPEKVPKKIDHLFPKSGENEIGWRVPQVDHRLSHFPTPFASRQIVTATTLPPSTTTQNNDHVWNPRMLTELPTFPTLIQNMRSNFQVQFERVTTPLPATRPSSTSPPTTTSSPNLSDNISSQVKSQRNARTVQTSAWSQAPRRQKPSYVLKEEKKLYSPRPTKSDYKRIQDPLVQSSNKQYTVSCFVTVSDLTSTFSLSNAELWILSLTQFLIRIQIPLVNKGSLDGREIQTADAPSSQQAETLLAVLPSSIHYVGEYKFFKPQINFTFQNFKNEFQ